MITLYFVLAFSNKYKEKLFLFVYVFIMLILLYEIHSFFFCFSSLFLFCFPAYRRNRKEFEADTLSTFGIVVLFCWIVLDFYGWQISFESTANRCNALRTLNNNHFNPATLNTQSMCVFLMKQWQTFNITPQ